MSNLTQSEGTLKVYLESYMSDGGELTLYLNSSQGAAWKPAQEDFSVSLGRDELAVTGSKTVEEAQTPAAILFLVDVSGSLDEKRVENIKTVISGITENLREQDKICIVAMGDELRVSGFMTDKEEIQAQIDALSVLQEDTNLYQGMEESLKILQSEDAAGGDKKCLVVLSDGAEDNSYGITREEVNTAIQDSRIPVYTVGMPKNAENQEQLENVKVLGSFARVSAGGIHYVPVLDGTDYLQTADSIWSNIMAGQVVTADISEFSPVGKEVYLQISVKTEEGSMVYTGVTVVDSRIVTESPEAEEEGDAEEGEGAENTGTETLQEQEETKTETGGTGKSAVPLFAGIAVLAAVIIGILFILAGKKKKKQKAVGKVSTQPVDGALEDTGHTQDPEADIGSTKAGKAGSTEAAEDASGRAEAAGMAGSVGEFGTKSAASPFGRMESGRAAGLPVQLIRMGIGESVTYSLTVGKSLSMGRDLQASNFALPEDRGLSGRHCIFHYEEGHLFLEDAGSKNGTYVNGVPIKTPIRLNRDDVLLIGSYEYRIYW